MPNVMDELTSENLKQVREAHRDTGTHLYVVDPSPSELRLLLLIPSKTVRSTLRTKAFLADLLPRACSTRTFPRCSL